MIEVGNENGFIRSVCVCVCAYMGCVCMPCDLADWN